MPEGEPCLIIPANPIENTDKEMESNEKSATAARGHFQLYSGS